MSSSISADYSPTTNYSYSSDLSLPPSSPTGPSRTHVDHAPPPRLSSPHIFRDIFAAEPAGPISRSPPRLPPLHGINFNETMQDVNRALQSANRAIQTAQEAFQSRRTSSNMSRRQDVVDLTFSPPRPPSRTDSFLIRTIHSHDSRSTTRTSNHPLNEPLYPRAGPSGPPSSLFVEEDDPTSRYAGQTDSLVGARRRFENQAPYTNVPYLSAGMFPRALHVDIAGIRRRDEEEAIRRQRMAREQWQQNQQRRQERDRLQQQRDQIMASQQNRRNRTRDQQSRSQLQLPSQSRSQPQRTLQNTGALSAVPAHQSQSVLQEMSPGTSSSSSVESVDLTSVNDQVDLAAALIHAQSSNPVGDPTATSQQPRSALTGYKCPICLEPPRNATTTICGHLFCHECIIETLKNSENIRREDAPPTRKVKGQCPVCRKELARKMEEGVGRTLVPLEIKLISKKKLEELRRQEKKRHRETEKKDKGKGKEKIKSEGNEIYELSSDNDQDDWGISGSSQKENKTKRVKLSTSEERDEALFGAWTNDDGNWA